jgi:hypothetical protein
VVSARHGTKPRTTPNSPTKSIRVTGVAKECTRNERKRSREYGYCSACQKTVVLVAASGKVPDHELPSGEMCLGSGGDRFTGLQERCAVCDAVKPVRDSDGRIVYHKVRGQRCDGSGRSPDGGRLRMNAVGVSTVVRGGSPSLGKRQ